MSEEELYVGREQTLVKHFILRKYLERFAHIVGTFATSITYVDCFSGPWNVRSEDLTDSSFVIALNELRKAKQTLAEKEGRHLKLRCFFLEKQPTPYARLEYFARQVQDAEVETRNEELEKSIPEVLRFVRKGGRWTFPFIFIDPTGWKGFAMQTIAPLLKLDPAGVLINFMTDYIQRFIAHPHEQTQKSFEALFGSGDYKSRLQGMTADQDREDVLFRAYAENVRQTGRFTHTCAAIVLYPETDRRYFHLIYATRNRKGVEVFKSVEKQAMEVMEQARADAKQRKRVQRSGQQELFPAEEMAPSNPVEALRERYLAQARQGVSQLLQSRGRLPYEEVWDTALAYPLVWEADLKGWIKEWRKQGLVRLEGTEPRQRVPRLNENNTLVWVGPPSGAGR
jgi:three-Cys-motif partner protein